MEQCHRLSGSTYKHLTTDRVLVEDASAQSGIFDSVGNWISGERRTADPEMCVWVAAGISTPPGAGIL